MSTSDSQPPNPKEESVSSGKKGHLNVQSRYLNPPKKPADQHVSSAAAKGLSNTQAIGTKSRVSPHLILSGSLYL